jgi:hypothetical protein
LQYLSNEAAVPTTKKSLSAVLFKAMEDLAIPADDVAKHGPNIISIRIAKSILPRLSQGRG